MIKRGEDPRTPEEKLQDEKVQQAIQDGTFFLLTPEERRQSIARARLKKEARKKAEAIGQDLARLRREANMTQEQLAKLIGTKRTDISRLESGRYGGLTIERFLAIIDAIKSTSEVTLNEAPQGSRGRSYYGFGTVPDSIMPSREEEAA